MKRSKLITMGISLLAAICLWAYVVTVVNPDGDTIISGIPVTFSGQEVLREDQGLIIKGDYDGKWSDFGGKITTFGAAEDRVGIPTDTWKLENWTVEDYNALYEKVKSGEIEISSELVSDPSTLEWENISFIK